MSHTNLHSKFLTKSLKNLITRENLMAVNKIRRKRETQ